MGEARRRGTYEERVAQSRARPPTPGFYRDSGPLVAELETRKLMLSYAGTVKGTRDAQLHHIELRARARDGDYLAIQLFKDLQKLSGGTVAAVRARLHAWFAEHEVVA